MANKTHPAALLLVLLAAHAAIPLSAAEAATRVRRHQDGAEAPPPSRLPRAVRAARDVPDNDAEATELEQEPAQSQPQQDFQYQQYQEQQQAQEARHFSRLADDNYEDEQDIVYDFSYEVKDPHTGNDFGHRQSRSGGQTQGQYRVLLPDGRMQVVDYVSDRDGYRPNIRYEDVGVPVFAGTEQHEQFADGTNHFEQEHGPGSNSAAAPLAEGSAQGPSPDEVRRRRRRAAAPLAALTAARLHAQHAGKQAQRQR